jgi:hypothetical protein
MADGTTSPPTEPEQMTSYLMGISPEMRGCAILDSEGELLATSEGRGAWLAPARELIAAADAAGDEPAAHAHVATGDGEVFMVRENGRVGVAVTERFTLASLVLFDLRAALRGKIGAES